MTLHLNLFYTSGMKDRTFRLAVRARLVQGEHIVMLGVIFILVIIIIIKTSSTGPVGKTKFFINNPTSTCATDN